MPHINNPQSTVDANLQFGDRGDTAWHIYVINSFNRLDVKTAIGGLNVELKVADRQLGVLGLGSTGLNLRVAAGRYRKADGTIATYAGLTTATLPISSTSFVYLDHTGTLTINQTGFPGDVGGPLLEWFTPLAEVDTDATKISAIRDRRIPWQECGPNLNTVYLALAGGTMTDTTAVVVVETGTANGTQFGAGATSKLAFRGKAPIALPAGAAQAALVDSTGGAADGTVADVGASYSQATINNNFADVIRLVNAMRQLLVDQGLAKGSA